MLTTPNHLYHTKGSASTTLKELPDETGEISTLRKAIKNGNFEDGELAQIPLQGLEKMEQAVTELLGQIQAMRDMLPVRKTRVSIAKKLMLARSVAAITAMPWMDPDNELVNSNSTMVSAGTEMQLERILDTIRNQKNASFAN
jgi:hypothetical protein